MTTAPDDHDLISLKDAGKEFNRKPASLRKAIHEGRLYGKKIGHSWGTTRAAMRRYVARPDGRTKPRKPRRQNPSKIRAQTP